MQASWIGLSSRLRKVDVRLPEKKRLKVPWREAGPPHHHDDKVDSDEYVVNKEFSLSGQSGSPLTVGSLQTTVESKPDSPCV